MTLSKISSHTRMEYSSGKESGLGTKPQPKPVPDIDIDTSSIRKTLNELSLANKKYQEEIHTFKNFLDSADALIQEMQADLLLYKVQRFADRLSHVSTDTLKQDADKIRSIYKAFEKEVDDLDISLSETALKTAVQAEFTVITSCSLMESRISDKATESFSSLLLDSESFVDLETPSLDSV